MAYSGETPSVRLLIAGAFVTAVALSLLGTSPARADEESKRLIQTSPTTQTWMTETEIELLARTLRQHGQLGGYMDATEHPNKRVVPLIELPILSKTPRHQKAVEKLLRELSAARLLQTVTKLSSFRNRYYQSESGLAAAIWIRDQFQTLARGRNDVEVRLIKHSFRQPSVVARIAGKNPERAAETVVLGGHEDSINSAFGIPNPSASAPGADDNASGIATLLEVFRVLIESDYVPERSIEFIAYAGEERGLLGSQDVAQQYRASNRDVVGVLQLDMTLYPGRTPAISLVSDYVSRPLTQFTEMLIDTYVKVSWREISCGYACSDHGAWNEAGYPAAFPFESTLDDCNPALHTDEDTVQNHLDGSFGLHFAKLALAFAVELGEEFL